MSRVRVATPRETLQYGSFQRRLRMGLGLTRPRRSGGGSGPDPDPVPLTPIEIFTGGAVSLWLNAALGVTESGGLVSGWANQGAESSASMSAAGSARPTLDATGGPNGSPSVNFDGVDDIMTSSWLPPNSSLTPHFICGVFKPGTYGSGRQFFAGNSGTRWAFGYTSVANTVRFVGNAATQVAASPTSFASFEIRTGNNAAADYIRIGATTGAIGALGSSTITAGAFSLGALNTGASFAAVAWCELVIMNYTPSSGELASYATRVGQIWGL
jgi:hypothetical protein